MGVPLQKEVFEKLVTLLTAAFGLVAALAWNEAIQAIFKEFFGPKSSVIAMLFYAIIVTIIAVFITFELAKFSEKLKR